MRQLLFLFVVSIASKAAAQVDEKTSAVLQKTQKAIVALNNYSYDLVREYKYPSDSYEVTRNDKISFYKNEKDSILGYGVYGFNKTMAYYYKSFQGFTLTHGNSTIELDKQLDSADIAAKTFSSYSIIAIQKLIPQLLQLKNIAVATSDSTIKRKKYFKVKVITQESYFDFYSLTPSDVKDFVREIFLLIDASTYLPYQYYAKFKVTKYGIDFLRNTYTNIKTVIPPLPEKNWEPGNYIPPYKIKVDNEQKLTTVGDTFPTTNLQNYAPTGSATISTASFTNPKTIYYFWIKSCGPCLAAFPKLKALQQQYKDRGVDVVMVNCYDKEKDIAFFYNKHQPNYAMLYNGLDLQNKIGVDGYPTVVIVDKNQQVIYSGSWKEEAIKKVL
jgi:thiol-disulfide isomerase/thioredoxin